MLPKKKRITKELFQTILKTGRTIHGELFSFKYTPQNYPSYAVVVPKAMAKQAVVRNSLRRKGYNTLILLGKMPIVAGIFFYKNNAKSATSKEIQADIASIITKISP